MPWVPAAIIGGSALAGGAMSMLSGMKGSSDAKAMTNKGIRFQKKMYKDYKDMMKKYRKLGKLGIEDLKGGAGDTSEMRDIMAQLKDFGKGFEISGKFDPDDPTYQFKKEQQEKGINQYLASRGLYNSRPGLNLLDQSNRALIADESQRQYQRRTEDYNRGYGNLMDLLNISKTAAGIDYNRALDMIKLGQGATSSVGGAGMQTAGIVGQGYGQKAGIDFASGQQMGDFWAGLGAQPLNFMLLRHMFGTGVDSLPSSNYVPPGSGYTPSR